MYYQVGEEFVDAGVVACLEKLAWMDIDDIVVEEYQETCGTTSRLILQLCCRTNISLGRKS